MKICTTLAQLVTVGVLMAVASSATAQRAYPSKPIRFIVPYAQGATTTELAHLLGQKLTESWGQPVIVDNRPGGNTVIGSEALVKSTPDGYTILLVTTAHVINPNLFPTPYDAIKDFAPVATVVRAALVLVLSPSVPANNLQEFIALAKSNPGQLNHASAGIGGTTHLALEFFNIVAGVKIQHISYKGGGQALSDLIGGHVQLAFAVPDTVIAHIKSGRLRAIATSGETRSSALPQVPTFTEAGLPGFDAKIWYGVLAPAAIPKEIVDKLSTEIARILTVPEFKEKLISQALEAFISTPDQFAALMKADMSKFAKVIKTANIKIEN